MPLESGPSKAAFKHNVEAEIAENKPVKQAVAIAYSKQRGDEVGQMTGWAAKLDEACARMDALLVRNDPGTRNDATIYAVLQTKLGREPTNAELKAEVNRIREEGLIEMAERGKLAHQRKK